MFECNNRYHGSKLVTKIVNEETYREDLAEVMMHFDENYIVDKSYKVNDKNVTGFDFCIETILNSYDKEKFPQKNILPLIIETSISTMFVHLTDYYETFNMNIVKIDDNTYVLSVATTVKTQDDLKRNVNN